MGDLAKINFYIENGDNHESSCLTDYVFKDIDYTEFKQTISFFRSDFSRSQFYSCTFNRNAFGRADFIDVYMKNTEFDSVDFGSCLIKNAYLEKTMFTRNHYRGVALLYTCFKRCVFRDEDFITNMFNCSFIECTFINCTFKKSSLEANEFNNCEFIKVDMSECIAENLRFDCCSLRDVYLGADSWTTFLYRDTDIYGFGFKRRGTVVDIWNGSAEDFINTLLKRQQYFEYLNTIISGNLVPSYGLAKEIELLYPKIIAQSQQLRKNTIVRILDMLLFYYNYKKISLEEYLKIYFFFLQQDWGSIPFEEALSYNAKLYKIHKTIEQFNFDIDLIKTIPTNTVCLSKFHINCDDVNIAIEYLENVFDIANKEFCGDAFSKPLIKVLKEEKGSVILTIASAAILTLFISYVAKKVMHNVFSIQIDNEMKKQFLNRLNSAADLAEFEEICTLSQKLEFTSNDKDTTQIDNLSKEITKSEILDIILNFLF